MKKISIAVVVFLLANIGLTQIDTIQSESEFVEFVTECIENFESDALLKSDTILGINMEIRKSGSLRRFDLSFKRIERKLSHKEYRKLYHSLKQKNYKLYAESFYSTFELDSVKTLNVRLKYKRRLQ